MSTNRSNKPNSSIDNLVKEAFVDHQENIEEIDADLFLTELEETGFFKKKRRRSFLFISISGFFLSGMLIYYFMNQSIPKEESYSILRIRKPKSDTMTVNKQELSTSIDLLSTEDTDSVLTSKTKKEKKKAESKSTTSPKSFEKKNETVTKTDNVELRKDDKENITEKIESNNIPTQSIQTKPTKDSVRVRYVVEVDTIKNKESVKIKKKKWEKLNNK